MKAPPADSDHGVSDFLAVDPELGTLEDFNELIKQLHEKGENVLTLKTCMQLVIEETKRRVSSAIAVLTTCLLSQ